MRELTELPVFRSPAAPFDPRTWRLIVGGLVARPIVLGYAEVLALHAVDDTSPFECVEGWRVPENRWSGVPVGVLLDLAGPLSGARFVTFHAGQFAMSLTLEEARAQGVLLAYRLNGAPLAPEHGAPLRLVAPGRECFYGVKWVERLELTSERLISGKEIALKRISAREGRN